MIELELPWPPSVNHYWRHVPIKRGHKTIVIVKISKEGREYQKAVARIIKESGVAPIAGAVAVKRILYCPDYVRRDEDNTVKAIYDSISAAGLWQDDSMVCAGMFEKRKDADGKGRVIIQIKPLSQGIIVKDAGAWLE